MKIATLSVGLLMAIGVGVAVGNENKAVPAKAEETLAYTLNGTITGGNNQYGSASEISQSNISWNVYGNTMENPWRFGGKGISDQDRPICSTTAISEDITKIVVESGSSTISGTLHSLTISVHNSSGDASSGSNAIASKTESTASNIISKTVTLTKTDSTSWAGKYYRICYKITQSGSSNKYVQFLNAKFYYESGASDTFAVTYDPNGATSGTVPTDNNDYSSGDPVTVLGNTGSLVKTGYSFNGWNTEPNGSGSHYNAGGTFNISANTTLYAEWSVNQYTLTYNANGGSGSLPSGGTYDYGTKVDVASGNELSNDPLVFGGWNTANDGSGEKYVAGSKITISENTTLYATWKEAGQSFARIEDVNDLYVGQEIAILTKNTGDTYALSTTQNSNNRASTSVTVNNDYTFDLTDDVQIITLGKSNNHWTFAVDGGYLYAASSGSNYLRTQAENDANGEWEITITDGVASITAQGANTRNQLKNNTTIFSCYSSGQTDVSIYAAPIVKRTLTSISSVTATVTASNEDSEWQISNAVVMGRYSDSVADEDVTLSCNVTVLDSFPTIIASGTQKVSLKAEGKENDSINLTNNNITATLTFVDLYSIERLYTLGAELGKSETYGNVVFDGIFMGYVSGRGVFVMNGDYGMLVFHAENDNSYVAGETYLTVSGSLCTYNHLYEIAEGATVSKLNDVARKANVVTPRTYIVDGNEDADTRYLANRKTSLSGVVSKIGDSTVAGTKATQNANNSIYVTVGGNEVLLYLTQANATEEICNKIEVGESLTCEGFSIYFTSSNVATFEVLFSSLVEADNYHAADFAKDLLKMTKGTCNSSYDGIVNNGSTLAGYWLTLSGSNYWLKVEAAGESNDLINGTPDSTIVVPEGANESETDALIDAMDDEDAIAAALYRYDYCTAKYTLTNFIGRTLTVSFNNSRMTSLSSEVNSTAATTSIVIISVVSLVAVGGYFFLRRRKEI